MYSSTVAFPWSAAYASPGPRGASDALELLHFRHPRAMPLPALVEVAPFSAEQLEAFRTTKAEIVIPGSKSITNRAIVLAALGDGEVTLRGALWSEDTEAMTDCMRRLGIDITVAADPDVEANRTITVRGCGGGRKLAMVRAELSEKWPAKTPLLTVMVSRI